MKTGVDSVQRHQLFVSTAFRHPTSSDHDDLVGIADGAEPVSNCDYGPALHQLFQGLNHQLLGFAIEGSGGLVQQQDGAIAYDHARYSKPLPLATGKRGTALTDHSVVALRHSRNEFIGIGELGCL